MSSIPPKDGYIYVIITREFLVKAESVGKVGYTDDIIERFHAYPKGSKLLYNRFVHDAKGTETFVLQAMRDMFIHRKDLGREYFEGSLDGIVKAVNDVLNKLQPLDLFNMASWAPPVAATAPLRMIDPDAIVLKFYEENKHMFQHITRSSEVHGLFTEWMITKQGEIGRTLTYRRLTSGLKEHHGVTTKVMRVDDDMVQVMTFPGINAALATHPSVEDPFIKFIEDLTIKHHAEKNYDQSATHLLASFHEFMRVSLGLPIDDINGHNRVTFGMALGKLCRESNGAVSKKLNCGPKRLNMYIFDIPKLSLYLCL